MNLHILYNLRTKTFRNRGISTTIKREVWNAL